jgi:hypothetical protein
VPEDFRAEKTGGHNPVYGLLHTREIKKNRKQDNEIASGHVSLYFPTLALTRSGSKGLRERTLSLSAPLATVQLRYMVGQAEV